MAHKKEETASFVLRLSQKIYENEEQESQVQWRGNIRHVQSGEEARFADFETARAFVQEKLSDLTLKAVKDKPREEQSGIIAKSFDFWKKVASVTPKLVMESIKDPKKQAAQIQEQIQEQIHQFGDAIEQTIEERREDLDKWLSPSKSDYKRILTLLEQMSAQIESLQQTIDSRPRTTDDRQ